MTVSCIHGIPWQARCAFCGRFMEPVPATTGGTGTWIRSEPDGPPMLSDELVEAMENLHLYPRLIAERAAKEAVAAEKARIKAGVETAPAVSPHPVDQPYIRRDTVLAIVEGETT